MTAPSEVRARFRSGRIAGFTESVIREMTRQALQMGAINLAQGYPDFPAPDFLKQAACDAVQADANQYTITWGAKAFRETIARRYRREYGLDYDPEREVTVCCGATEGMISTLLAVTNPGDEIIVFEPFYENYRPDALLCAAETRVVPLYAPGWTFDPEELRRAFSAHTKAIVVNTPHNPTGHVFTLEELRKIAALAEEYDTLVITDEIYERILYDGVAHHPMAALPGMRDRTVLVNSMSKTWSVTGWRVGWVLAPADLTDSIRKVHDFLTVNAPAPLQQAGIAALELPDEYYRSLTSAYLDRRNFLLEALRGAGFQPFTPRGAYYVLCDISAFGYPDDVAFVKHLIEDVGVAGVPGSSFFAEPERARQIVRFCFCKSSATLTAAAQRLHGIVRR
jgi:aspartate/methionine/tyrosine aminotransferase